MAVRLLAPRSVLNVLTAPLTPTIPGIYVEQDTIETADNSNYIGPKTINEFHLIMELYIIIRLYFTKPRGQRFFYKNSGRVCFDVVHVYQVLPTAINGMVKWKRLVQVMEKNFWVQFLALPLEPPFQ